MDVEGGTGFVSTWLPFYGKFNRKPFLNLAEVETGLQIREVEKIVSSITLNVDKTEPTLRHFFLDNSTQHLPELRTPIDVERHAGFCRRSVDKLKLGILFLIGKFRPAGITEELLPLARMERRPHALFSYMRRRLALQLVSLIF